VIGSDINNDGYLDKWVYSENSATVEELTYSTHGIVYQNPHHVTLELTSTPTNSLETTPPATHEEW